MKDVCMVYQKKSERHSICFDDCFLSGDKGRRIYPRLICFPWNSKGFLSCSVCPYHLTKPFRGKIWFESSGISGVFGDLASNFLRKIDTCKQMMPNIEDVVGQGLIFQKNHFVSEHPPTTTTTPVCILDRVQETGKDPTQPYLDNSTAK